MENKCGFCGKKPLSLRRCSGCQQVYYCSTVCQRDDWRGSHKVKCKDIQNRKQTGTAETPEDFPFIPKSESGVGNVVYPSEPIHGITHDKYIELTKQDGRPGRHVASDFLSSSILSFNDENLDSSHYRKCMVCGKASPTVKTCTRCKMADYCSKECQKQDWKLHRLQCKGPKQEVHDTINTDGYRREEEHASSSSRSSGMRSGSFTFDRPIPRSPDLNQRSYAAPEAFDKVKSLTWKLFPHCTILDFVREIPHELFGMRPRGTNRVAVGFISRYHQYVLRHCIFLQDKDGEEVYVGFYLQGDDPRPYFRWEDVTPGRFLCIQDPYIHRFLDQSVGIRVDDPSTVRAFSV
ncbi:uncharacterized protein LOC132562576 [Ylistrum balloti]|uniref:uncharacterized protein LOC132562576 n=1 Tax=Ylistrum balloti TaxID=509963 RepID=UPI0029058326|nr:uncharacterized protein LOC132562576 [Ylistrum balloti]